MWSEVKVFVAKRLLQVAVFAASCRECAQAVTAHLQERKLCYWKLSAENVLMSWQCAGPGVASSHLLMCCHPCVL